MEHHQLGGRVDRLERDVGELRTDFASVKATLGSFGSVLGEIKATISSGRPAWYVLAPIAIGGLLAVASGVLAFGSLKGDLARFEELKTVRARQIEALDGRIDRIEQRQYDEMRAERDALRRR
jgi:hypothetical protein